MNTVSIRHRLRAAILLAGAWGLLPARLALVLVRYAERTRIEALLPERALEIAKVAEQSEREHLKRTADLMEEAG